MRQEYIFLQGILKQKVFEDEQNFWRDNFLLSAIISMLSAERSEARHADDQGKGKVVPRISLFLQENCFCFMYTLAGYIFLLCRGLSTTRPEIGKQVNLQDPLWIFSNNLNYGCPQFSRVPLKIAGHRPAIFQ